MPGHVALENDSSTALPDGVWLVPLQTHVDHRGDFTEVFRNEWHQSPVPLQWNLSRNESNVLRGVQVHALHWDYLCVVAGEMIIGLHDMRPEDPGARRSAMLRLESARLETLVIPPGVAHGFYSPRKSMHLIGTSAYYNPEDHRHCRWDCPELGLDWPCVAPTLSATDRAAPSYVVVRTAFLAATAAALSRA